MGRRGVLHLLSAGLLFLSSITLVLALGARAVVGATTAIPPGDWPQLGRDPQRSNASPQTISGPYRFYWRWTGDAFASRVQPVIYQGNLYLGTLTGKVYDLDAGYDAQGGSPRIIWQQDLADPVRASAGVDPSSNVVVVGTQHGAVYGLDVATGGIHWTIPTGGAIVAAPLIANGTAYLGSRDGFFYAIQTSSGHVLWRHNVGTPILGSAALSTDGSTVFFVAENAVAYALSATSGSVIWQSQLQGQSASDRWPVVVGDVVIFRTQPIQNFTSLLHDGDTVLDSAGAEVSSWTQDWNLIKPAIVQYLGQTPEARTFFALSATTGQPIGTAPVLYTFGNGDAPSPPTVLNSALYVVYRPRHGIQQDGGSVHVTTKYDAELGRMDPTSLDITDLTSPDTYSIQFRATSDEPSVLSVAGNLLLVDSWERLGGIRLTSDTSGSLESIAEVAWSTLPCASTYGVGANDNAIPFFDHCPWLGPALGEGHARAGAVVGAGRIFWQISGQAGASALGAIGPANGVGDPPLPTATPTAATASLPGPVSVSNATLSGYVWTEPPRPVASPAADLQQELNRQIQSIVATNQHLMPYYLERGAHGPGSWPPDVSSQNTSEPAIVAGSNAFWYDPGELVLALSLAYPYLDPSLQQETRLYLQAQMALYPPLQPLPYGGSWSWLTQGAAREPYPVPIRGTVANAWPMPGPPLQTLYALWAYARYTGDWGYVSSHWSDIQKLWNARSGTIDSYAEIAGAIGYARLAQHLNDTTDATAGEAAAIQAMQNGYNFGQWLDAANTLYPGAGGSGIYVLERPGRRAAVFFGLTPEVGRYLHDTNLAAVQWTLQDLTNYPNGCYLWYASHLSAQCELSETSYHTPEIAWSVFLAQAYVQQADQARLRFWLDGPWGLGDLWYIEKLVATIEASKGAPYADTLPAVK